MSAVDPVRRPAFRALLLLGVLAIAYCAAQEPVAVCLRDAVGDTIDLAERDSFHLFPNTGGFRNAVILALPGPEFYAEITRPSADSTANIFLRIMPTDLERIRFLIDNHEFVEEQRKSDSTYSQALASFWRTIEDKPLRNMAGEPAIEQEVIPVPTEVAPLGEPAATEEAPPAPPEERTIPEPRETMTARRPPLQPASIENRYNYALHGLTLGSAAGGYVGSHVAIEQVGNSRSGCATRPVRGVNHPVFWTTACGLTALGTAGGYAAGSRLDRETHPSRASRFESNSSRHRWSEYSAVVGSVLGIAFYHCVGSRYYGKAASGSQIGDDSPSLTLLPMALTSLCIVVEVVTIGYRIGRAIDRRNAQKAEAQRRALGR